MPKKKSNEKMFNNFEFKFEFECFWENESKPCYFLFLKDLTRKINPKQKAIAEIPLMIGLNKPDLSSVNSSRRF